jgi:predicted ATPase
MERYVLTGGPGSGKTSIILALELLGECVTREGAEDFIRYQQSRGIKEPWREANFQGEILRLCQMRENYVPADASRVFHDRSLVDGLAYQAPETELHTRIMEAAISTRYTGVFLIELPNDVKRTVVRRENSEESRRVERKLEEIYTMLGYKIVRIPMGCVDDRVNELRRYL